MHESLGKVLVDKFCVPMHKPYFADPDTLSDHNLMHIFRGVGTLGLLQAGS